MMKIENSAACWITDNYKTFFETRYLRINKDSWYEEIGYSLKFIRDKELVNRLEKDFQEQDKTDFLNDRYA